MGQLRGREKEAKEKQKVLLRKIEKIYNSIVYVNVQAKNSQNYNISINGRVENGQKTGSAEDRNTWLRTQITSVLEQKDQQTVKNLTEEILQKVKTKDASVAIQQTERVYLEQVLEGLDLEITDTMPTQFYCNCSKKRIEKAIISIGKKEIQEMIDEGKEIEVKCHFCNTAYHYSVDELKELLKKSR